MSEELFELDAQAVPESVSIQFLQGGFKLGQTNVPFFSTCVQVRQLASFLQLPSQLPVDPNEPIKIEELFQRDLDQKRIDRLIPYLEDPQRMRFFNALTVVLLPLDPANPRRLAASYPDDNAIAPAGPANADNIAVGPVMLSYPSAARRSGRLKWNTDLTAPIVLDGQHRYRAMRKVLEGTGPLSQELGQSEVSILFLVLDERAGFKPAEPMTVLAACRRIFIDLNEYAVKVARARMALLDDSAVGSMALRAVLASSVEVSEVAVHDRVDSNGRHRLPLTLVGWRTTDRAAESAKFDTGPYVTSLLTLQDMVEYVLGIKSFESLDYDAARSVVEELAARLDLESDAEFGMADRLKEIDSADADERPFDLPARAVAAAGEAFGRRFGPRIVAPLTRLAPYRDLIDALRAGGVLESPLEPWLSFNADERQRLLREQGVDDPRELVQELTDDVKQNKFPLAFQVVFQKAFIYSLNSMLTHREAVAGEWGLGDTPEASLQYQWIEKFNAFLAPSLAITGPESAFYGSGIKVDGNIDFRKTRIRAITGFVSYCMLADLSGWAEHHKASGAVDETEVTDFVQSGWSHIKAGPRDSRAALYSLHGKSWRAAVQEHVAATTDFTDDADGSKFAAATVAHAAGQLRRVIERATA